MNAGLRATLKGVLPATLALSIMWAPAVAFADPTDRDSSDASSPAGPEKGGSESGAGSSQDAGPNDPPQSKLGSAPAASHSDAPASKLGSAPDEPDFSKPKGVEQSEAAAWQKLEDETSQELGAALTHKTDELAQREIDLAAEPVRASDDQLKEQEAAEADMEKEWMALDASKKLDHDLVATAKQVSADEADALKALEEGRTQDVVNSLKNPDPQIQALDEDATTQAQTINTYAGSPTTPGMAPLNIGDVYDSIDSSNRSLEGNVRSFQQTMDPNSQMDLIQLQKMMQDWTIQTQLQSNVIKNLADALKNTVSNLR